MPWPDERVGQVRDLGGAGWRSGAKKSVGVRVGCAAPCVPPNARLIARPGIHADLSHTRCGPTNCPPGPICRRKDSRDERQWRGQQQHRRANVTRDCGEETKERLVKWAACVRVGLRANRCTLPPADSILCRSDATDGLWSVVMASVVIFPLGPRRPRTQRLSPTHAQVRRLPCSSVTTPAGGKANGL